MEKTYTYYYTTTSIKDLDIKFVQSFIESTYTFVSTITDPIKLN